MRERVRGGETGAQVKERERRKRRGEGGAKQRKIYGRESNRHSQH